MLDFFKHKKFWLPLVMITAIFIVTELTLRLGWYDQLVKPKSRLGQSVGRMADLKKFDIEIVDWVTIGDSKFDWGLNHKKVREFQKKKNINHIRLSLAGSNFMTIQTSIEWSINNLPDLDGILLGMYEGEFLMLSHPAKELKTSWPFRQYLNHTKFDYYRTFKSLRFLRIWSNSFAVTIFASDIKNFVMNPFARFAELKKRSDKWMNHIDFRHEVKGDLCAFELRDLNQCIASAKQFNNIKEVPSVFRSAYNNCSRNSSLIRQKNEQWKTNPIDTNIFKNKWEYLFEYIIENKIQLKLVLLPENEYYNYMSKPSNAGEFVNQLVNKYISHGNFEVIDLRDAIDDETQCKFYFDNLHFNNLGIELITDKIINELM